MYAIILSGGKQYKVAKGDTVEVEKLYAGAGEKITLDALMTVDGDKVNLAGKTKITVEAQVLGHGKEKKVVVYKYKPKKNVRKKKGHRQPFTAIKITKIG